jgi:hypothetical protein
MSDKRWWPIPVLSAALLLAAGAAAQAQSAGPNVAPSNAVAAVVVPAPPSPAPHAKEVSDRVVALVQARKCKAAVNEAREGGEESLAQQVSAMCGYKPSSSPAKSASADAGGGRRGGGGGGGRRGN